MKNNPFQRLFPRPALAASGPVGDQAKFPTIYLMADPPKRTVQGERRRPGSDRPSAGRVESPPRRDQRPSGSSSGGGGFKPPSGGGAAIRHRAEAIHRRAAEAGAAALAR